MGWPTGTTLAAMAGLVPGIHVFFVRLQDVDGRDKPGHDDEGRVCAFAETTREEQTGDG
jgi:hypothetical protein